MTSNEERLAPSLAASCDAWAQACVPARNGTTPGVQESGRPTVMTMAAPVRAAVAAPPQPR